MCPISLCERTYCSYGVRLDLVMIDDGREEPLGARAVIYPVQQDAWGRMRVSHAHQPLVVCVPGGKVRRGFGDCGSSVRASFRVHPMGKGPQHRRWLCTLSLLQTIGLLQTICGCPNEGRRFVFCISHTRWQDVANSRACHGATGYDVGTACKKALLEPPAPVQLR